MKSPSERSAVLPSQWGAKVDTTVDWADDGQHIPRRYILHYGGGANKAGQAPYSQESESAVLRSWEAWHMSPNRPQGTMRAIAYNWPIGQTGTLYYGRGPKHSNGGHYGQPNRDSQAVVFILGGNQIPSVEARRTFARLWLEEPYEGLVQGHRDVGATECPGDWTAAWIRRQGYVTDLGVHSLGDYAPVIQSIKWRLWRLGYRPFARPNPRFNKALHRQVRRFQKKNGLQADGVVGPQTIRAMTGLLGEIYDVHDDPS